MTDDFWARVRAAFDAVADGAPGDVDALVREASGGDDAVRHKVMALLSLEPGNFLAPGADFAIDADLLAMQLAPGTEVGGYRIVAMVGRGGMGEVYDALRTGDDFTKRVAIKVLGVGTTGADAVRRFQTERRILAGLNHRNIAPLLDGGLLADGRPYLVMEFVAGEPVTAWCTSHHLSLDDRLVLFRQICGAVSYAHRNLIVHRDLKPGNILVTSDGTVKLLDFGIAKVLDPDTGMDRAETATRPEAAALTPEYAAPEQLAGGQITTATDVYALGLLLYELLTGSRPFATRGQSVPDLARLVLTTDPPMPSTAVNPERLGTDAKVVRRHLRGDLDAILLKTLRTDPAARYGTVDELADDLRRHQDGLPVAAMQGHRGYRLAKFVRRRRGVVLAAGVAMLALVGGAGGALWQAATARAEARKAIRISEFLQSILGGNLTNIGVTHRLPQANLTLQEVLDTAAAHLPEELAGDPMVRASLHRVLGAGYAAAMRNVSARRQFDSAIAIHTRERGPNDTSVAVDLLGLADILSVEHPDSAEQVGRRALRIFDQHHVQDTAGVYVATLVGMAGWQSFQGKLASADSSLTRFIAAERARVHPRLPLIAYSLGSLGLTLHNEGKLDSAGATMRRGIAMFDSSGIGPSYEETIHLMTFGSHLNSRGRGKDALPVLERARDMAHLMVPPGNALHIQIGISLADARSLAGDTAGADAEAKKALDLIPALPAGSEMNGWQAEWIYARILRREERWPEAEAAARLQYRHGLATTGALPYYLADTYYMLGAVLTDRGKYAEAEPAALAAYQTARDKLGATNSRTIRGARELARLYLRWGHDARATPYLALLTPTVADSLRQATPPLEPTPEVPVSRRKNIPHRRG